MSDDSDNLISDSVVHGRGTGTRLFIAFLGVVAVFYAVILTYHMTNPPSASAETDSLLEQCRRICLEYGLITTGHIRNDAQAYLNAARTQRLTEGLAVILQDKDFRIQQTHSFSLLGQAAPDFRLPDHLGRDVSLSELGADRPVVVVFYLGYGCSHCVAQLLALDQDLHYFRELDADIVAISSDSPEHTRERYAEYGEFRFHLISDLNYEVSRKWGVIQSTDSGDAETIFHGTYVVDRTGRVIWGAVGREPFLDNKTLLHVIAESQGLLPPD